MVDDDLTRAVLVFVTRAPHGYPHLDPAALQAEFGDDAELRAKVEALAAEMMSLPFQGEDLLAGMRAAASLMGERHPELGSAAIAELGYYYAYCWR